MEVEPADAARDRKAFGATQPERLFATEAEREAAINEYVTKAASRAAAQARKKVAA